MQDMLRVERDGAIATVTLNRPDKMNAFDLAMWEALPRAFDALGADPGLRCIVIAGAGGRAFSAGADIAEFTTVRNSSAAARDYAAAVRRCWAAIEACPHPLVAQIEGSCVGGGLELACLADIRIGSDDSRYGVPIAKLGLTLAYAELRPVLQVLGPARTLEVLLEGRIYDAGAALRMGLLNRVVPRAELAAEVRATAARIAAGAPLAARAHRRFVRRLMDPAPLTDAELDEAYACFDTADFREGLEAFLGKRAPRFAGR